MSDRTTKLLLGLIALGLWANVGVSLLAPSPAIAQGGDLRVIADGVGEIKYDLDQIYFGRCLNNKLC